MSQFPGEERERRSLPFIGLSLSSLLSLSTLPFLHVEVLWCVPHCADVTLLLSRVVLSQFKRTDTGLYRLAALEVSDDSSA